MTLLFQLYPTNKDFGVTSLGADNYNTSKFKYNEKPPSAPLHKHQRIKVNGLNSIYNQ